MSRFSGQAHEREPGVRNLRTWREVKHQEAEDRNARTPHDRTRAHREGRCAEHHA